MRSYDYCHFEICLASSECEGMGDVDKLRREAARLADQAVNEYKNLKIVEEWESELSTPWRYDQAKAVPENERTPKEKAIIKFREDKDFAARFRYDYEDEWQNPCDDEFGDD